MRALRLGGAALVGALAVMAGPAACSEPAPPPERGAIEQRAPAATAETNDDGLPEAPEAYATRLKGPYRLTEDREGGRSCAVTLTDERTIGGYAASGDNRCIAVFALPWFCGHGEPVDAEPACAAKPVEDIVAWFVAPDDAIVLIDAARQPLFRFASLPDGLYYQHRDDLESLALYPAEAGGTP